MRKLLFPAFIIFLAFFIGCNASGDNEASHQHNANAASAISYQSADSITVGNVEKTEEEWKQILTEEEFYILRERGTEPAFENEYYDNKKEGIYYCAACGLPLYSSKTKFDSGTGWPSFWDPIEAKVIERRSDNRYGMERVEVVCAQCGSHLGHIFDNSTVPSGKRHCLNSLALDFKQQSVE